MIITQVQECVVPDCKNQGLILYCGKLICGECFKNIYDLKREQQWEDVLNASKKNTGN